jgi:hypothetical protein
MTQEQLKQRVRVLRWGTVTLMTEIGVGPTISALQGPGFNWGLAGIPLAGATMGGLWLWYRGWRNQSLEMPNLDGLESPVKITAATDA